jgi:hypothetical protein
LKAPKGSSLEAYETARKAGATSEEALAALGQAVLKEPEPSREEEADARSRGKADEDEEGWTDEEEVEGEADDEGEVPGETIGERVRARRARA